MTPAPTNPSPVRISFSLPLAISLALGLLASCAQAEYGLKEKFGIEKRDILVARVEDVSDSQEDAQEEFADALEAFRAVVDVNGGELEQTYDRLKKAYNRSDEQAEDVRERVRSVKRVATDLFAEWKEELTQYSDAGLRRASQDQLSATQRRYDALAVKMDASTKSMDPVLAVFNDRVLYLKHNLNARAIAAIGSQSVALEADVARLIADMEQSIAEADAFIADMRGGTV